MSGQQICFEQNRFYTLIILSILLLLLAVFLYIVYYRDQLANVDLYSTLTQTQLVKEIEGCKRELSKTSYDLSGCKLDLGNTQNQLARAGPSTGLTTSIGPGRTYNYDAGSAYTQLGIIYNNISRFPLYGRRKYSRGDKWEYYIIDETRNRLKIQVKTKNDNELFDGDTLDIPVLNETFNVQLYEIDTYRYNY